MLYPNIFSGGGGNANSYRRRIAQRRLSLSLRTSKRTSMIQARGRGDHRKPLPLAESHISMLKYAWPNARQGVEWGGGGVQVRVGVGWEVGTLRPLPPHAHAKCDVH
jgi:hypothetical protein